MKKTGLIISVLLFPGSAAFAADNGFFAEAGIGTMRADLDKHSIFTADERDTTWSLGAGYMFNNYLGLEGGYRKLGESSLSLSGTVSTTVFGKPFSASGTVKASADVNGWFIGPLFNFPVNDRFGLNARLGAYRWTADETASASGTLTYDGKVYAGNAAATQSESKTDPYYGLGATYNLGKNTAVGLNWTRFRTVDGIHADTWDARLKYFF